MKLIETFLTAESVKDKSPEEIAEMLKGKVKDKLLQFSFSDLPDNTPLTFVDFGTAENTLNPANPALILNFVDATGKKYSSTVSKFRAIGEVNLTKVLTLSDIKKARNTENWYIGEALNSTKFTSLPAMIEFFTKNSIKIKSKSIKTFKYTEPEKRSEDYENNLLNEITVQKYYEIQ